MSNTLYFVLRPRSPVVGRVGAAQQGDGVSRRRRGGGVWFLPLVLVLACGLVAAPAGAQAIHNEYAVKAAFLFSFTGYVDWPPSPVTAEGEVFGFGVTVPNPFGETLAATLKGKEVNGRQVQVLQIMTPDDVGKCRVLFVDSRCRDAEALIARARTMGVLTVGEKREFLDRGGVIAFELENDHVRFAINLIAAQQAGLTISSKLLRLATEVRR